MPSRVGATMETLVDDQSGVTQDQMSPTHVMQTDAISTAIARASPTIAQVRANGTVVLGTANSVKHVVSSPSSATQAIAVPQPGGAVSIVHVSIPNQPVHVQSVIQQGPNQQSVIQAPGGTTLQSLPKNVILLNKVTGQGSVIHSTDGESGVHPVQLIAASGKGDELDSLAALNSAEEESRKRREILARRPSYRKILSELSSTDTQQSDSVKEEPSGATLVAEASPDGEGTITVSGTQYHTTGLLKGVGLCTRPAEQTSDDDSIRFNFIRLPEESDVVRISDNLYPIQLATATQDGGLQGLQTLTMTNSGGGATGAIVQYAQGQDGGQFFVPVTVSAADLQAYQIRTSGGSSTPQGVVMTSTSNLQSQQQMAEEASRKRELRLLKNRSAPDECLGHTEKRELRLFKNREAAKECRRKKKEYIKCLENRVAVLENQNKALIEELKSLKELYCQKND